MRFRTATASAGLLLIVSAIVAGCATDDCDGNRNTLPEAGFYANTAAHPKLAIDGLTVFGVGAPGDSLLLDSAVNVSSVPLPFNLDAGSSTFVFRYDQAGGLEDRVTFCYEAQPYFVSSACGVSYRFHIKGIEHTSQLIDSIAVPGDIITNAEGENIRIYFRYTEEEGPQ